MSESSQLTTDRASATTTSPSPAAGPGVSAPDRTRSPLAAGLTLFAAVVLITVGAFQFLQGLAAVVQDDLFVITPNSIYELNLSVWGWIHLAFGVLLAVTGVFLLRDQRWARITGIALAGISAIANFLFIPTYPVWALLIIALDVAVIWALTTDRGQPA